MELETGVKLQLPRVLKIQGLVREAGLQGFLWKALGNADAKTEHERTSGLSCLGVATYAY